MALCLYAVVPAKVRARRAWRGLQAEPLRVLRCGDLGLLVGEIERAPQPSRSALERYDALIRQIATEVSAVLPARFAAMVRDADRLRAVVQRDSSGLRAALTRVGGGEQMTLRIRRRHHPRAPSGGASSVPNAAMSGRMYLLARAAAFQTTHDPDVRKLLRRLLPVVRLARVARSQGGDTTTIYHLIDRGQSADYLTIVRQFASHHPRLRLRASGPFPPYAFAPRLSD